MYTNATNKGISIQLRQTLVHHIPHMYLCTYLRAYEQPQTHKLKSMGRPKAIALATCCTNASERNGRGNDDRSNKNCRLALAAPFRYCYLRLLFYCCRGSSIRPRWFEYFFFYLFFVFSISTFFLVFYTLWRFINNVMHFYFIQLYSPLLL